MRARCRIRSPQNGDMLQETPSGSALNRRDEGVPLLHLCPKGGPGRVRVHRSVWSGALRFRLSPVQAPVPVGAVGENSDGVARVNEPGAMPGP